MFYTYKVHRKGQIKIINFSSFLKITNKPTKINTENYRSSAFTPPLFYTTQKITDNAPVKPRIENWQSKGKGHPATGRGGPRGSG